MMPKNLASIDAGLNLRDGVLGKVEKNSYIALPGKRGHVPSKLCVLSQGDLVSFIEMVPGWGCG